MTDEDTQVFRELQVYLSERGHSPKLRMTEQKCQTCNGRRYMFIKGANGQERCSTCSGTGYAPPGTIAKATTEELDLP